MFLQVTDVINKSPCLINIDCIQSIHCCENGDAHIALLSGESITIMETIEDTIELLEQLANPQPEEQPEETG